MASLQSTQINGYVLYATSTVGLAAYDVTVGTGATVKWTLRRTDGTTVTTNQSAYVYRVKIVTTGTGTDTGTMFLAQNVDGVGWVVRTVHRDGVGSNHPYLFVDSDGLPKVTIDHPSNYTVRVIVEETNGGNSGATYGVYGADSIIGYDGSGNTKIWTGSTLLFGANTVLHSGNYNSYSPTLTGGGASGTWGINITGNAATATNAGTLDGLDSTDFMRNYGILNNTDQYVNFRVMRNNNSSSSNDGMYIGYANSNSGITRIFGGGATTGDLIKYSNYTYEPGSFRAPYFYDSDNTAYYIKASGTSNLYKLQVGNGNEILGLIGMGSSYFYGVGITSAYTAVYSHYQGNGVQLGYYNGTTFTPRLTVGNDGNVVASTSMRAPIFYDSDNTSYYGDFASTSRMYGAQFDYVGIGQGINTSYSLITNGSIYLNSNSNGWAEGTWKQRRGGATFYDVIDTGNYNSYSPTLTGGGASGTWGISITGSAGSVAFNNLTSKTGGTGTYQTSGDFRAPIFYDSDNTAYYLDPNSNSNLNTLTLNQINYTTSYNGRYTEWYCGTGTGPASSGNRYEIGRIGIDFNDWNSVGTFEVELQEVYYAAGCRKRFVVSYGYGGPVIRCDLVEANGSGNFGNFRVIVGSEVVVSGDWRYIPIYVDVQAYTTVAIKVRTTRQITNSTVPEVGYAKIFTSPSASSISSFSTDSTVYLTSNQVGIAAPIFYDSDNTSYYLDPAGTSNIRKTNIVAIGQSWDDGLNLYSADATNRWNVLVDNGAGDNLRFAFNNSERFSVQTNGVVTATGDMRAPIFYDSADTTYFADLASTNTSIYTAGIIRSSGVQVKGSSGGGQIYPTMSNGGVSLYGGNNFTNGAYFTVTGIDYGSSPGAGSAEFVIRTNLSSKFAMFSYDGSTWTGRYSLWGSSGNVTIGSATIDYGYKLYVIGDIYATGNITAYSDASVKTNIREIENPLDRVLKSRGVVYDRTDIESTNNIGFIAQELEEQFPELVSTGNDGRKGVMYQNMVAVLLEAMKEQQKQINELKSKLN